MDQEIARISTCESMLDRSRMVDGLDQILILYARQLSMSIEEID